MRQGGVECRSKSGEMCSERGRVPDGEHGDLSLLRNMVCVSCVGGGHKSRRTAIIASLLGCDPTTQVASYHASDLAMQRANEQQAHAQLVDRQLAHQFAR